jgi:hypothetical protein
VIFEAACGERTAGTDKEADKGTEIPTPRNTRRKEMAVGRFMGRTLLAGTTLLGATLAPAVAGADPAGSSVMTLSVTDSKAAVSHRAALLVCHPPGGTHPKPTAACASVDAADGNFDAIRNENSICSLIYQPVTASASGTWKGRQINYTRTYPNRCVLESQTGAIFRF